MARRSLSQRFRVVEPQETQEIAKFDDINPLSSLFHFVKELLGLPHRSREWLLLQTFMFAKPLQELAQTLVFWPRLKDSGTSALLPALSAGFLHEGTVTLLSVLK